VSVDLKAELDKPSVIGRDAAADLRVDHPTVSRQHSRVAVVGGQWTITDLGSHNGTIVCGQKLTPERPMPLQAGDDIRIGACTFRVLGSVTARGASTLALTGQSGDRISRRSEDDLMPAGKEQMRRLADAAVSLGGCTTLTEIAERAGG
jgi:pSer/pThr/pTyr-binding forkhead associated (FHA) protein